MRKRLLMLIGLILALSIFVGCGGSDVPQYDFAESEYEYVDYTELVRNPDDYIEKPILVAGTVRFELSDDEEISEREIREVITRKLFRIGYSPNIVQGRLVEDDKVLVYCVFLGIDNSTPYGWATKIERID